MAARIVLAVRESQYIEPLLHYVRHSEYGDRLHITAFSRMDTFVEYMKEEEVPDAVVGDPAFIEAWLVEGRVAVPWAVLSEEGGMIGKISKSLSAGQVIAKYQALPSLLTSMLQLCEVERTRACSAVEGETLLLGVVSGSGSSGKTVIALNIVKQLSDLGLSVFYLNLESVDSSSLYLRSIRDNMPGLERLLYEIQANRDSEAGIQGEIQSYAIRHENPRCDAFKPVSNVKEMLQMNKRDTLDLMELVASGRRYDVVIIDTGSIGEERTEAVMEKCGVLLWVLRDDDVSIHKAGKWLSHYAAPHGGEPPGLIDRSRFVMNCFSEVSGERPPLDGIPLDSILPYISSWNQPYRSELYLNSPLFHQEILQLCRRMLGPMLPHTFAMESRYE
ncbi:hypothetical protein [Paenibacillus wynnii]|uniref:hypothetical protein n=1 Tax=Paenibacillus wynnii TaxID=268407 RepID=UPI00068FCED8|nr:hypothetical protein [Paenibacillus wynnii]